MTDTPLWLMMEGFAGAAAHGELAMAQPNGSLIANRDAIGDHLEAAGQTPAALAAMPTPQLAILTDDFAPSFFLEGLPYASRALRDALALTADHAWCAPVDPGASAAAAQAADYATLIPLLVADPTDRDRSDGEWVELIGGAPGARVWLPLGGPTRPAPRIALRHDFVAPAPIFRQPGELAPVVTDATAERLLAAGFNDLLFVRLGQERGQAEAVFKAA